VSRVYTDTLEPRKPTQDITLGTSGETISVAGDSINVNTVKDKGGNTLWTSDGSGTLSSVNAGLKGNLLLLDTNTFTDAASSTFTTLIDSTYDAYIFKWNAINPATDDANFTFQSSTDGGSNYNITATTTYFSAKHSEGGSYSVGYEASYDQAQSTNFINLAVGIGNESDECAVGVLHLFTPSNATYVKHFYSTNQFYHEAAYSFKGYVAGYFNTPTALNAISFKMNSGNMDGEIKMYGLL